MKYQFSEYGLSVSALKHTRHFINCLVLQVSINTIEGVRTTKGPIQFKVKRRKIQKCGSDI